MKQVFLALFTSLFIFNSAIAKDSADVGTVQIPRTEYDQILLQRLNPGQETSPSFIIDDVTITAHLEDEAHRIKGEIFTEIKLEILKENYTVVPILPLGIKIRSAEADGKKIRLIATSEGLSFGGTKGQHSLILISKIDESVSESARGIALPIPAGSNAHLVAELNGTELSAAISPALSTEINIENGKTIIVADIPETAQAMVSWRRTSQGGYATNRSAFVGALVGENSIHWKGEIFLEVFDREGITYRLLPISTTMSAVTVDGQETTIVEDEQWHASRVRGVGKHKIQVEFIVPVESGISPTFSFEPPHVPVSRYELKLPGKKAVKVEGGADVQTTTEGNNTIAVAHFPPSIPVSFSWTEEVPSESNVTSQVNSSIYQSVAAEDGLLVTDALALIEVARGEKTSLDFSLPAGIQVNKVIGPSDVRTDWRVASQDSRQIIRVFFERALKGEFSLRFSFDRPLGASAGNDVEIPLIAQLDVQRSRGMIALLSSKEFSFEPTKESSLIRVGENQLLASWKKGIEKPVVHAFKYVGGNPLLAVKLAVPEKIQGKLDAIVDTLISVGDVSIKGNASIDVMLKSGKLNELELELPLGINVLNVVAPSLRNHQVTSDGEKQKIALQFTQEMEGSFLIQLNYERIFGEGGGEDVVVPTVTVNGAEVEQGRVAIEALSAVEVQALKSERLSTLEPSELPKRLLMNTSNPILLGFKYFQANPPHELRLKVVRHKEVEPQSAVIDTALYQTLITKDGVAITTTEFTVRNSRKQFLKLALPAHSEVWSATVAGKVEKPALEIETAEGKEPGVLFRLVNSSEPFKVQIVYKTKIQSLGYFGFISAILPTPDMVVNRSNWTVALPDEVHFGRLSTIMDISENLTKGGITELSGGFAAVQTLPDYTIGSHFSLKRLYATEGEGESSFSLFYLSPMAYIVAMLAFAIGLGMTFGAQQLSGKKQQTVSAVSGLAIAIATGYYLAISLWLPVIIVVGLNLVKRLAPFGKRVLESQLKMA